MAVLDASALLAFLHDEPGAARVREALEGAMVSAVNWAEVVQKASRHGVDVTGMREEFEDIGVAFEPFSPEQAEVAARLWHRTRPWGLSLADRACLALGMESRAAVLTADRDWARFELGIRIVLVR